LLKAVIGKIPQEKRILKALSAFLSENQLSL